MSLLCLLLFLLIYYYSYYYYYPGRPPPLGSTSRQHSADGPSAAEMFHYVQINNIHKMVQQMHFMMMEYEHERLMDELWARRDEERDGERDRRSRSRSRSR